MIKRNILLILIFIFITGCTQNKLTETKKLVTTAEIWGFLKYYHPVVGKGKFDWDSQLFNILPKIKKANNKQELSLVYLNWIKSLGKINPCKSYLNKNDSKYFNKNFNLSWTQDSTIFTNELITKLKFIENNRFQGENYYVSSFKNIGNVNIKNEPQYNDFKNEDIRLLTLFRYWNIIEYFYPYKYQTDQKWENVLEEMIPKFLIAKSESEFHLLLLELITKIDDSHAYFYSKPVIEFMGGGRSINVHLKIIDNKAIITRFFDDSLAKKDNLQIGDLITKVNGKTISSIFKEKEKYIPASNPSVKLKRSIAYIFGVSDTTNKLNIEYIRNNVVKNKTVNTYSFKDITHKKKKKKAKWKILENNIGYINMGKLVVSEVSEMMQNLMKTKAIIFDLRNYPNNTLYAISNFIIKKPRVFAKFIAPDLSYPGKFIWTEGYSSGSENGKKYEGKIIILINEKTQSHAEFTTMCFQTADDVTIIGNQTSGADGNVSKIELFDKNQTQFTGIGVFYPDGKETQRIGIIPDIEVKQTIKGIQQGRDEILEKAIEFINKEV